MDFRVRIILSFACICLVQVATAINSVEEIPPPLQSQSTLKSQEALDEKKTTPTLSSASVSRSGTKAGTANKSLSAEQKKTDDSKEKTTTLSTVQPSSATAKTTQKQSALNAAAPEFEDRNEQDEGGKGEEDPDAHVDEGANVAPPADDVAAGEGVAKEDTEPAKGKEKEENQLGAMVEDAKGNAAVPPPNKIQTHVDFEQSEDSHFMTFFVVGGLLVFCLYLLHHNKKKILGLMFEGRSSGSGRRNVRYRRLSQRDDHESFKEDVIY